MDTDKKSKLQELKKKMHEDKNLPLRESANNLVFGDGDSNAEILFIGEGPGYWEDLKGIPFVGNAGAFLNFLLSSISLKREDVYITNVIHYRAPDNRDPEPQELEAFKPYLDKIIEIIGPKVVITLGRFSMAKFLPGVSISKVHGKAKKVVWNTKEMLVIPMYHPAAGLRSTSIKIQTTEDFKKIPDIIKDAQSIKTERLEENRSNVEQMKLV